MIYELIAWSLEWEGSIQIGKHTVKSREYPTYDSRVEVSNTNLQLLEAFQRRVKIGKIYYSTRLRDGLTKGKKSYKWYLSLDEILTHLPEIRKYLVEKDQQADYVLRLLTIKKRKDLLDKDIKIAHQFCELYSQDEIHEMEFLYCQCRELNRRGIDHSDSDNLFKELLK